MRKKVLELFLLAASVMLPLAAVAQIDVDHAVFRYDANEAYWEIYYTISRSQMTYVNDSEGQPASLALLRLKLMKDGLLWKELNWKYQDVLSDTLKEHREMKIVDRVQVLAPPGNYAATLKIEDLNNPAYRDSASFTALLPEFPPAQLCMSDIELASAIEMNAQDKQNPFYKNTLLVIPNPARVFSEFLPALHYYVETYHLLQNIPDSCYCVHYSVLSAEGKEMEKKTLPKQKMADAQVEIGSLSVRSLPTGTYSLHFAITDTAKRELISKDARFFVYHHAQTQAGDSTMAGVDPALAQSQFGGMTESELDQDFGYAVYLATLEEKKLYAGLKDVQAKRQFLYSFWLRQDRDPSTPVNEFYQEYLRRVLYCNEKFGGFKKPGYQTDRGRVYIQYGKPSFIERNPSTEGNRPYEVWSYDEIQGGVIFVFADFSGSRDYILLHSTALGEARYPNYMERINRGY